MPKEPKKPLAMPAIVLALVVTGAAIGVGVVLLRVTIVFGPPTPCGNACWAIVVESVSSPEPLSSYTVFVELPEDASGRVTRPLAPGVVFSSGSFSVSFTDLNTPNRLDEGDRFRFMSTDDLNGCVLGVDSLRGTASVGWAC
ncbi:MAG TPA: hypothetical protein VGR51_07170 [Thermoplasmata archaeon]|nr:hypothetical protein [Thermoplasmata archaeon]